MTVYVELVIFNNLAINALLIILTLSFRKRKMSALRIIISAVIGAAVAVGYAIAPTAWQIVTRVLLAPILVAIFDKYSGKTKPKKFADYIQSLLAFCFLTFALGGCVYGLSYMLGVDIKGYATLGLCAAGACVVVLFVRRVVKGAAKRSRRYEDVYIELNGKALRVKGLCDSGNTLTDEFSGLPVMILSREIENSFNATDAVCVDVHNVLNTAADTQNDHKGSECKEVDDIRTEHMGMVCDGFITVKTIADEKQLPLVKPQLVEIGGRRINAYCALSRKSFDGFDVILQNSMF